MHFRVGSTNEATYTPEVGKLPTPPEVVVTNLTTGAVIEVQATPQWSDARGLYVLKLRSAEIPPVMEWDRLQIDWAWDTEAGQHVYHTEYADVVPLNWDRGWYGTVQGIRERVLATSFTATSRPFNMHKVAQMLKTQALVVNNALRGAGYSTPLTDADSVGILAEIVEAQVAAAIMERIIMSNAPSAEKVESAAAWKREASQLLQGIVSGATPLPGSGFGTGSAASNAGILTRGETLFPREDLSAYRI